MPSTSVFGSFGQPRSFRLWRMITLPLAVVIALTLSHSQAVAVPATPAGLPTRIETLAPYVGAASCSQSVKPGTRALMRLLISSYPHSLPLGMLRECTTGGRSEHKEGRALDWGNRAWVPQEAANVASFTRWVLAADTHGNRYAMARRLGIMYMIWDDRIWEAFNASAGWQPYLHPACSTVAGCNSTLRHRDHLHISLSWDGAMGRTSFWSGVVGGGGYAASRNAYRAPTSMTLSLASASSLQQGAHGPAVVVLQKALRMPVATGYFGPITTRVVRTYQRHRGLPSYGIVARLTWGRLQQELAADSRRIASVNHRVLEVGSRGRAVRVMESALNRRVDGVFTSSDRAAVRQFQALHHIPTTGVVARLTWKALQGV